jgi:hypothetical protein
MMDSVNDFISNIDAKYHLGIRVALGISSDKESTNVQEQTPPKTFYSGFQLPIQMIHDSSKIHPLSKTVSSDLEMVASEGTEVGMYDYILNPQHRFAKDIVHEWNQQFTTDVNYLKDTQAVIKNMDVYHSNMASDIEESYCFDQEKCDSILEIWKDTKEDADFLEKYHYLEWDMVKHLNKSSHFLQSLSIINMTSPIMSFIIPIIFLVFPFIILKIQQVPITFSLYLQVLRDIAKNHFIGKALSSIQSLTWDKIIYILITIGLYFLQIYQNINMCCRFYRNIRQINSHLIRMRDYVAYSVQSMNTFCELNGDSLSYAQFCQKTREHSRILECFHRELSVIRTFEPGFSKITEIGYLLKCFYELHSNTEYEDSLRYSMGFEGYINNLSGIHQRLSQGVLSVTHFHNGTDENITTTLKKQYYPAYIDTNHVKNNCHLNHNIIITGPNASGKTTMLKATTINIIFSQQFGMGCYESFTLHPYTHIHSYLNIPDTSGRDSLFQAESRRCKDILDIIKNAVDAHHFCIFDELYSGTNPTEATKSAYAFLLYLSKYQHVDFVLTTHYVSLCKKLEKKLGIKKTDSDESEEHTPSLTKSLCNYKMNVVEDKETGKVKYTYVMKPGISNIQGAVLILEQMEYPKEILDEMKKDIDTKS